MGHVRRIAAAPVSLLLVGALAATAAVWSTMSNGVSSGLVVLGLGGVVVAVLGAMVVFLRPTTKVRCGQSEP